MSSAGNTYATHGSRAPRGTHKQISHTNMSKANLLKDPQYTNTQIYGSKQTNKSTQSDMNLQRIVLTSLEQELLKFLKKSQTLAKIEITEE